MLLNSFLFIIFIILSAFFSAAETAIFSLSNLRLRRLGEKYPQGRVVKELMEKPTRLLSTVVFGNMLVNIGISSLATAIFVDSMGEKGVIFAVIFSLITVLFLGEIFPKTLAIYTAEKLSLVFSPVLSVFSRFFSLPVAIIEKIVAFVSFSFVRHAKKTVISSEELKTALVLSKEEGHISREEEEMISYVLKFKDTWVSEIITARIDIHGLDIKSSHEEVLKILRDTKHSKFPVYEKSLDNIVGILYAKDVFLNPDKDYHELLKTPILVPESKRIDDLLILLLEKNERIAVVLDEYGGTAGMVTFEDIAEEIFGEIYDEFETPKEPIEKITELIYRVYGKTPIKIVNLTLGLDLPEEENTLAGLLLAHMEKIPRAGESFNFQNVEFTVERATAKRIICVVIKIAGECE